MIVATIAAVIHVILTGPEQPATIRRQPVRAKTRPAGRRPAVGISSPAAVALPDSDVMRLRVLPAAQTTILARIRSGVALVVLVAVLGALLALAVSGLTLGAALLIRSAAA